MTRTTLLNLIALSAIIAAPGCASTVVQPAAKTVDVAPHRKQRKDEVIAQFETRRNDAQYKAAVQSWERGDKAGCHIALEQLLFRAPDHQAARMLFADLLVADGKLERARKELTQVLQQAPHHAPAHHAMGLVLESMQQSRGAVTHYERAVELEPNNELFQMTLEAAQLSSS